MQWTMDECVRRMTAEAGQAVVANLRTNRALIGWAQGQNRFVYIGRRIPRLGLLESPWANRACIIWQAQPRPNALLRCWLMNAACGSTSHYAATCIFCAAKCLAAGAGQGPAMVILSSYR